MMPFSAPFPYSKKGEKRKKKGADFYIILYTFYKTKSPKYRLNKPYFGLFHKFLKKLKVDLAYIVHNFKYGLLMRSNSIAII